MEFKTKLVDGVLDIYPNVTITKHKDGQDVTVHALHPVRAAELKQELLDKIAKGKKIKIDEDVK